MTKPIFDEAQAKSIEEMFRKTKEASMALAAQGWTTPFWFDPPLVISVFGDGNPDQVDANFIEIYQADSRGNLKGLISSLLRREDLNNRQLLLRQINRALGHDDFAITIPALLTILEGQLMQGKGNSTRVIDTVKQRVLEQRQGSVLHLLWRGVEAFVRGVYSTSNFSDERPRLINRHWILHGRDTATWNFADSLRLLQAIDVISSLESRDSDR